MATAPTGTAAAGPATTPAPTSPVPAPVASPAASPGLAVVGTVAATYPPAASIAVPQLTVPQQQTPRKKKKKRKIRKIWIIEDSSSESTTGSVSSDEDGGGKQGSKKNTRAELSTKINIATTAGGTAFDMLSGGPESSASGAMLSQRAVPGGQQNFISVAGTGQSKTMVGNAGLPSGQKMRKEQQPPAAPAFPEFDDVFGGQFPFAEMKKKKKKRKKKKQKKEEQVPDEVIRLEIVDVTPGAHQAGGQPLEEAETYDVPEPKETADAASQLSQVEAPPADMEMGSEEVAEKISRVLIVVIVLLLITLLVLIVRRASSEEEADVPSIAPTASIGTTTT